MANPLARLIDVPAMGFAAGPEFEPDQRLDEGSEFGVGELELRIIQTPGHSDDHLCFRVGDVLFSGDHIIGGSSVMVETMGPYLDSLRKLRGTGLRRLLPGHGNEMNNPDEVIDWYLAHRLQRHEEIAQAISEGASNRKELVETVYSAVDSSLYPLASRSVEAHLALLYDEGRIAYEKDTIVLVPPNPQ